MRIFQGNYLRLNNTWSAKVRLSNPWKEEVIVNRRRSSASRVIIKNNAKLGKEVSRQVEEFFPVGAKHQLCQRNAGGGSSNIYQSAQAPHELHSYDNSFRACPGSFPIQSSSRDHARSSQVDEQLLRPWTPSPSLNCGSLMDQIHGP